MNQRERLLAVFERRPLDHLPWVPDLTYWMEAEREGARLPERYVGRDGPVRLHEDVGACVYYGWGASPAICTAEGVTVTSSAKGEWQHERIECDGRVLEKVQRWLPESFCYGTTKHFVTEASQLALVREICARRRYAPNPEADKPAAALGGRGHPITAMPRSPLPALLADWVGAEGLTYLMADAPDEVERTLQAIDRANDGFFELLPRVESKVCHFCDNLSADTSGGYWDRYCADYYRRRVAQVHAAGKFCVTQLDGATRALIPRLAATGLDGIESLTPSPVGDLSIEEISRLMEPHDMVFWGGLPGAMFVPPFQWDDLQRLLDTLHRLWRGGRRVIVGSADQVPPGATLETIRRVGEYLVALGA